MEYVVRMGETRNAYEILTRKPEIFRTHNKSRNRWKIILKWTLNKLALDGLNWIQLAEDSEKL